MEQQKETARPIIDQLKEYAETRVKLLKLEAIESSTSVMATLIIDVAAIICLLLTFLFASVTLALFLADLLHSNWKGFGTVSVIYMGIAAVFILAKRPLKRPVVNILIRKLFN